MYLYLYIYMFNRCGYILINFGDAEISKYGLSQRNF